MDAALIAAMTGLAAVVGLAVFAQIKALYHFVKWWSGVGPERRWKLSLLGPFAILWNRGLTDEALRQRALFIKWEGVFLLMFALIAIGDVAMKQQPNNFIPASATDGKR